MHAARRGSITEEQAVREADLLDSISRADDEVDALLDAYNEDSITFDRLLDELRELAVRH